ncbi:hypothetical protein T03_9375, partial [Trichinella britovi]
MERQPCCLESIAVTVAVCRGSFVLSLAVLNKVLALALPLSKSFQDSCLEVLQC